MNNLIIAATDGHFMLQSRKKKKKSCPFSSGDILKKMHFWTRHNSQDAQIWTGSSIFGGQCDLFLMLRLPTWLMWPRGHWSLGCGARPTSRGGLRSGWGYAAVTGRSPEGPGLRWLHVPAAPQSSDRTMKERRGATGKIKRAWKNSGDELQWTRWRGGKWKGRRERLMFWLWWSCENEETKWGRHVFLSLSVPFLTTHRLIVALRKVTRSGNTHTQKSSNVAQLSL